MMSHFVLPIEGTITYSALFVLSLNEIVLMLIYYLELNINKLTFYQIRAYLFPNCVQQDMPVLPSTSFVNWPINILQSVRIFIITHST